MLVHPSALIFGEASDIHVKAVLSRLSDSTVPLIIDFARFGIDYVATYLLEEKQPICLIRDRKGTSFALDSVDRVWWRRPQPFTPNQALPVEVRSYVGEEFRLFWGGLLSSIADATWYNHFDRHREIERKLVQLQIAKQLGFNVPATCVTSDRRRAVEFLEQHRFRAIFKSFSGSGDFWQPTRPYLIEYEQHLAHLGSCPVIFQEFIEPHAEYRVTVVDDQIYAARKDTRNSRYKFDTRIDCALKHCASSLPEQVENLLLNFMRVAGLRYGAFDLIESVAGDFYFIEVNPSGQFLYIEAESGQDISGAMGRALSSNSGRVDFRPPLATGVASFFAGDIFARVVEQRVAHLGLNTDQ